MSVKDIPIIPSIVVTVALAIMIALGFWQLGRADEKALLLARYESVSPDLEAIDYPAEEELETNLYRTVRATCGSVESIRGTAGTNKVGVKGWAQMARCTLQDDVVADVALGWSRDPSPPEWEGGEVSGILAPGGRIVADPPLAGLGPLAKPDPADLPNNHLSYAVQWFLFALTALVIYILALQFRAKKG